MDVAALRRALFDLCGTLRIPDLTKLDQADWAKLDALAAAAHLQPLLHVQHRGNPAVPAAIAAAWEAAYRTAAMIAMARDADLRHAFDLLEHAGLAPIALKGAWLARHAYPEPAQRPMLDVDLLLAPDTALKAWDLLQRQGYGQALDGAIPIERALAQDKHLPPLISPHGTLFELHQRLWELPGRLDHASPPCQDEAIRARAVLVDGLRYPCGEDMLVHLIVHAAYSHRLDCGPRVLVDIDMLLRHVTIDWAGFWKRSRTEGWRDGARLVLELVVLNRAGAEIDFTADTGKPVPPAVRDGAIDLLLIDPARRASAGVGASTIKGGFAALLGRALRRRGTDDRGRLADGPPISASWAAGRLAKVGRDLAAPDVRRQAVNLARLSAWFDA